MMVTRALALHPSIGAFHEPRPRLNAEAYSSWAGTHPEKLIRRRLARKRKDLIHQVESNGWLYLESSHFMAHLIPHLRELFDARFVHLHRDGRRFVRSGLERTWYVRRWPGWRFERFVHRRLLTKDFYSYHRLSPPRGMRDRFDKIAWLWAEINHAILTGLDGVPANDQLRLPVERFGREGPLQLLDFIGVDADDALVHAMLKTAERKPNRTGRHTHAPPSDWPAERKARFDQIAGHMMARLGY